MILARKTFCLTHNLTLASVVKVISTKFINKFGWCRCSLFLKDQKLQQLWEGLNWEPNIPCSYLTYWAIRLNKWIRYTRISNLMSCWSKLKYFSSNIRQLPLNPSNPMTFYRSMRKATILHWSGFQWKTSQVTETCDA